MQEQLDLLKNNPPATINWSAWGRNRFKVTLKEKPVAHSGKVLYKFAKENGVNIKELIK